MNNLEDIVKIAMEAYDLSVDRTEFELLMRRHVMQASYGKNEHTYTIRAGSTMGTWTTTQTPAMSTQSNIINKELLNG